MAHLLQVALRGLIICAVAAALLLPGALTCRAAENKARPARVKISGYGILGNFNLKRALIVVQPAGKKRPEFLDANFVEDAALILLAKVKDDGFLEARLTVELTLKNGHEMSVDWREGETILPRPLEVREVRFVIRKGVLYHYGELKFTGLHSLSEKEARSYFVQTGFLVPLKSKRVYTPARLRRSLSSVEEALERKGYESAQAEAVSLERDDRAGAVNATIQVHEGLMSAVRSVRQEFFKEKETTPEQTWSVYPQQPYSRFWLEDYRHSLLTNSYHDGYPDARVEVTTLKRETAGNLIELDLLAQVKNGPLVKYAGVEFRGQKRTSVPLMRRRVRLEDEKLLDRIKVEEGRLRLAQLGVFESVDLKYDLIDEHDRGVIYDVKEGKSLDVSLLFGYGSYDLLRAGVEIEQHNIWGLGQTAQIKLVQSFKTSSGDYVYTVPELIGKDVDLFVNATGLRRQEVSFLREEYGGGFGVHHYFKDAATDTSLRYDYMILNAAEANPEFFLEGAQNPNVGTIILDVRHDRRDNPLYPRRGYNAFLNFEEADPAIGGDVQYQRFQLLASYHHLITDSLWVNLGFGHGADFTEGNAQTELPFNRRFFPGGENSIRGYREGEASPRNAQGQFIGAECYMLGSVELEQALTPLFSVVGFSDNLGFAEHISHYPFDTGLFSVGGGIRLKTPIGPLRLEYGHNLNPRPGDPPGTLLLSVGAPF